MDPDPGGPKTCASVGSGSATLLKTIDQVGQSFTDPIFFSPRLAKTGRTSMASGGVKRTLDNPDDSAGDSKRRPPVLSSSSSSPVLEELDFNCDLESDNVHQAAKCLPAASLCSPKAAVKVLTAISPVPDKELLPDDGLFTAPPPAVCQPPQRRCSGAGTEEEEEDMFAGLDDSAIEALDVGAFDGRGKNIDNECLNP
jgi:hypothetical protein